MWHGWEVVSLMEPDCRNQRLACRAQKAIGSVGIAVAQHAAQKFKDCPRRLPGCLESHQTTATSHCKTAAAAKAYQKNHKKQAGIVCLRQNNKLLASKRRIFRRKSEQKLQKGARGARTVRSPLWLTSAAVLWHAFHRLHIPALHIQHEK